VSTEAGQMLLVCTHACKSAMVHSGIACHPLQGRRLLGPCPRIQGKQVPDQLKAISNVLPQGGIRVNCCKWNLPEAYVSGALLSTPYMHYHHSQVAHIMYCQGLGKQIRPCIKSIPGIQKSSLEPSSFLS